MTSPAYQYKSDRIILHPLFCHLCTLYCLRQFSSVQSLSRVRLFAAPWTVALQASPSMGFSRQEYWSGLPFPSPGDLPDPGIEPGSPTLQADALLSEPPGKSKKANTWVYAQNFSSGYQLTF